MCEYCEKIIASVTDEMPREEYERLIATNAVPTQTQDQIETAEEMQELCEAFNLKSVALLDKKYLSLTMDRLRRAGERLFRNPTDEYGALAAIKASISPYNMAQSQNDPRFTKYLPMDSNGEPKDKQPKFNSTFFCQTENKDMVVVQKTREGKSWFSGLQSCGKAFACPVCGKRSAAIDKKEIKKILKTARRKKMTLLLLTLTVPHKQKGRFLYDQIDRLCSAFSDEFCNGTKWRNIKEDFKYVGHIRGLEIMLGGENGAHPHFHIILIFDSKINAEKLDIIRKEFLEGWKVACENKDLLNTSNQAILDKFNTSSVNLKRFYGDGYLTKQATKWKYESGIVQGLPIEAEVLSRMGVNCSKAKNDNDSLTPFGFVVRMAYKAAFGNYSLAELARDIETVVEYLCAMHWRHQINKSRNLYKNLGLVQKSKKELKKDSMKNVGESKIICGFDRAQYLFIRKHLAQKLVKKAIEKNAALAIETLSKIFLQNGFEQVYTADEAELYVKASKHVDQREDGLDYKAYDVLLNTLKKVGKEALDVKAKEAKYEELCSLRADDELAAVFEAENIVKSENDIGKNASKKPGWLVKAEKRWQRYKEWQIEIVEKAKENSMDAACAGGKCTSAP